MKHKAQQHITTEINLRTQRIEITRAALHFLSQYKQIPYAVIPGSMSPMLSPRQDVPSTKCNCRFLVSEEVYNYSVFWFTHATVILICLNVLFLSFVKFFGLSLVCNFFLFVCNCHCAVNLSYSRMFVA